MAQRLQTPTGPVTLSRFARAVLSRPGHRRLTFPGYVCKYCGLGIRGRFGDMWRALGAPPDMAEYCFPTNGYDALVISYHYPRGNRGMGWV